MAHSFETTVGAEGAEEWEEEVLGFNKPSYSFRSL